MLWSLNNKRVHYRARLMNSAEGEPFLALKALVYASIATMDWYYNWFVPTTRDSWQEDFTDLKPELAGKKVGPWDPLNPFPHPVPWVVDDSTDFAFERPNSLLGGLVVSPEDWWADYPDVGQRPYELANANTPEGIFSFPTGIPPFIFVLVVYEKYEYKGVNLSFSGGLPPYRSTLPSLPQLPHSPGQQNSLCC